MDSNGISVTVDPALTTLNIINGVGELHGNWKREGGEGLQLDNNNY